MQTKINRIRNISPQTLQADVQFIDGDTIVLEHSYKLSVNEPIESIYPQMKEDLNNLEKGKQLVADFGAQIDQEVDLTQVKSSSEIQAESDKETETVKEITPEDATTPLG